MVRTLLTGFGPFGTVTDNPTARLVAHFAREGAPGHTLTTCVLPVSFQRASEEIASYLQEGAYDAALLLGVAGGADGIRLERYGRNRDTARLPDVDGQTPAGRVHADAPDLYTATAPLEPMLAELRAADLPATISEDAGGYVCNRTYFVALHTLAQDALATQCLFVHVPPDERTYAAPPAAVLPFDRQIDAVERALRQLTKRQAVGSGQ